jgi:hypothetical protein
MYESENKGNEKMRPSDKEKYFKTNQINII